MISERTFGTTPDGRAVTAYRLSSQAGFSAVILNYGATLQGFHLPDGTNIALGHDTLEGYLAGEDYRGALIGRNANRIVGAHFDIDGETYSVPANADGNNLHSGPDGFDAQIWDARVAGNTLQLSHDSPDGHQGFPGRVNISLDITLIDNVLRLEMRADTTAPTPVNPTWHPYWHLGGTGRIDGHDLFIEAENRTELGTREPIAVAQSRFDLRKALPLGAVRLDDNYVDVGKAVLTGANAALTMTSSLPDLQVYTGDELTMPRSGIALEPQFRPNDVNLAGDCILRPGEHYAHWIAYTLEPR